MAWHAVQEWLAAPFERRPTSSPGRGARSKGSSSTEVQGVRQHPGKAIASGFSGAFKAAFNGIGDVWNNTVGRLSFHIPSWVPGIGGDGFDVPNIPHLAQGGLITTTGFVYAHAGEAITPMRNPVARGPAVNVEHLHLADTMDIDLFMRRAAWVAQTQKVWHAHRPRRALRAPGVARARLEHAAARGLQAPATFAPPSTSARPTCGR